MKTPLRATFSSGHAASALVALLVLAGLAACKPTDKPQGAGIIADASATAPVAEAGAVDIAQCVGCQLAPIPAWSFEGVYRESTCTEPLAQLTAPACAIIPALGSTSLTYVDEVGLRKAAEVATVTLAEQVAPESARFRKAGKGCVRANEGAVDVTPLNCANLRACRDQAGALTCTTCRTFATGCPDFEETRLYATINDPGLKAKPATAGGGNIGRLGQCCAQLASEGRRLGASPEGGALIAAAAQCSSLVAAAGPNGTAPEVGVLRAALAGRNLPAVCAGF